MTDEIRHSLARYLARGWFRDWPVGGTIACYLAPAQLRLALPLMADLARSQDDPVLSAAILAQRDFSVAYLARHDELAALAAGADPDPDGVFAALLAALEARGADPVIDHAVRGELCDVVTGLPAAVSARVAKLAFTGAGKAGPPVAGPPAPRVSGRNPQPLERMRALLIHAWRSPAGPPAPIFGEVLAWMTGEPDFRPDAELLLYIAGYAARRELAPAITARCPDWWSERKPDLAWLPATHLRAVHALLADDPASAEIHAWLDTGLARLDAFLALAARATADADGTDRDGTDCDGMAARLWATLLLAHEDRVLQSSAAVRAAVTDAVAGLPPALRTRLALLTLPAVAGNPHDYQLGFAQGHVLAGVDRAGGRADPAGQAMLDWAGTQWYLDGLALNLLDYHPRPGAPLPPAALAPLRRMAISGRYFSSPVEENDVRDLIGPPCNPGEAWAEQVVTALDGMPAEDRAAWDELLAHATLMRAGRPTKAWRLRALSLVDGIGAMLVAATLGEWLLAVPEPRTDAMAAADRDRLDEWNVRLLCGLIWVASLLRRADDHAPALAAIVHRALVRVPGHGPASMRVASAAIGALADTGGPHSRAELATLAGSVTSTRIAARIDKELAAVSR